MKTDGPVIKLTTWNQIRETPRGSRNIYLASYANATELNVGVALELAV